MSRNLLGPAVLALLATGGGTLLAVRANWATATASVAGLPEVELAVTGSDVAPGAAGLAIVVMAAAAGVIAAGPRLRRIIGVLVVVSGLIGVVVIARRSAAMAAEQAQAIDDAAVSGANVAWDTGLGPALAIGGFVLTAAVGVVIARFGPRWATMGARYDAPATREPDSSDLWKSMDDGVDPTV